MNPGVAAHVKVMFSTDTETTAAFMENHWNDTNEAPRKTCFSSFSILFDNLDLLQV